MRDADERSAESLAKPDSNTVPFSVSTWMLAASTALLSMKRVLICAVMAASSM
jgi:hypothetical protein